MLDPMSGRFLSFVRRLALPAEALSVAALAACGGSQPTPSTAPAPSTSTTATGATSGSTTDVAVDDPTAGSGPCRCSWNTNAAAAPRVCKKGETSVDGVVCQPGNHKKPHYPKVLGPLDPPSLVADGRAPEGLA